MSPALGSSAIRCFEGSDAIEIHDGITFDFYTGLPHIFTHLTHDAWHDEWHDAWIHKTGWLVWIINWTSHPMQSSRLSGFVIRWTAARDSGVIFHAYYLSFARSAHMAPQHIDNSGVTFVCITVQPRHCLVLLFKLNLPFCGRTQAYLAALWLLARTRGVTFCCLTTTFHCQSFDHKVKWAWSRGRMCS